MAAPAAPTTPSGSQYLQEELDASDGGFIEHIDLHHLLHLHRHLKATQTTVIPGTTPVVMPCGEVLVGAG